MICKLFYLDQGLTQNNNYFYYDFQLTFGTVHEITIYHHIDLIGNFNPWFWTNRQLFMVPTSRLENILT